MKKESDYNLYSGFFANARNIYFRKINKDFRKADTRTVLDVACGQGDFLHASNKEGFKAEGVDIESVWVDYCNKRGLKAKKGDVYKLPYKNATFDSLFSQSLLEHLYYPTKALKEMKRVLKRGGTIVISTPTPSSSFWDDPTHVRPYTPISLKQILATEGFKDIQVSYVVFYLLGLKIGWSWLHRLMNIIPFPMGSNLVAFAKKQ